MAKSKLIAGLYENKVGRERQNIFLKFLQFLILQMRRFVKKQRGKIEKKIIYRILKFPPCRSQDKRAQGNSNFFPVIL